MKKDQLKKSLRPIVKECIHEILLEEGLLSTIISEVVKGTSGVQPIVEQKKRPTRSVNMKSRVVTSDKQLKALEQRKKMLDAIGKDAYNGVNLFEGTDPLSSAGDPNGQSAPGPLSGQHPNDPGVDISTFMAGAEMWKKVIGK